MHLFTIGDLHLSFGVPKKSMDVFDGWADYQNRLSQNWKRLLSPEDAVVLAGDLSWGMTLEEARADFTFVESLPGTKILLKGNHDYWWASKTKMEHFFAENGFTSLRILHNNCYPLPPYAICGTRGWVSMQGESADEKVLAREVQRLTVSIEAARAFNLEPLVFLHYPPIYGGFANEEILRVLHQNKISRCYFGHVHGKSAAKVFQGVYDGTEMTLVSGDYLHFIPKMVL